MEQDDGRLGMNESNWLVDARAYTYYVKWNQAAQPIWRFPRH